MTRKHRLVLFSILSLAILMFIFSNSLQNGPVSNAKSSKIAQLLAPLLNPFGWIPKDLFHALVRKLAHFTEFCVLGISLTGVSLNINWQGKRRWLAPVLSALLAAVADETIQRFTWRTSAFKDVLIDASGTVCGVLLVALILLLWQKYKRKQEGESSCLN